MPERKREAVDEKPKAKAVTAVFNPVGDVRVNATAPSGNVYQIKPRESFKIAAEDVPWFFEDWDWAFRQRLCLTKDYQPTCGYHDPKNGAVSKPEPESETLAETKGETTRARAESEPEKEPVVLRQQDSSTFLQPEPEPEPTEETEKE